MLLSTIAIVDFDTRDQFSRFQEVMSLTSSLEVFKKVKKKKKSLCHMLKLRLIWLNKGKGLIFGKSNCTETSCSQDTDVGGSGTSCRLHKSQRVPCPTCCYPALPPCWGSVLELLSTAIATLLSDSRALFTWNMTSWRTSQEARGIQNWPATPNSRFLQPYWPSSGGWRGCSAMSIPQTKFAQFPPEI